MSYSQPFLYEQSQQDIVPIIDYFPTEPQSYTPQGSNRSARNESLVIEVQTYCPSPVNARNSGRGRTENSQRYGGVINWKRVEESMSSIHPDLNDFRNEINFNTESAQITRSDRIPTYQDDSYNKISQLNYNKYSELKMRADPKQGEKRRKLMFLQRLQLLQEIDKNYVQTSDSKVKNQQSAIKMKNQRQKLLFSIISKLEENRQRYASNLLVKPNVKPELLQTDALKQPKTSQSLQSNQKKDAASLMETGVNQQNTKQKKIPKRLASKMRSVVSQWNSGLTEISYVNSSERDYNFLAKHQVPIQVCQLQKNEKADIQVAESQLMQVSVSSKPNSYKAEEIYTFSNLNSGIGPIKHTKNSSIEFNFSEQPQKAQADVEGPVKSCVLCNIICKKCSFH